MKAEKLYWSIGSHVMASQIIYIIWAIHIIYLKISQYPMLTPDLAINHSKMKPVVGLIISVLLQEQLNM